MDGALATALFEHSQNSCLYITTDGLLISVKVTADLAESNGSLLPSDDLKTHLRAECLYIGIISGTNTR